MALEKLNEWLKNFFHSHPESSDGGEPSDDSWFLPQKQSPQVTDQKTNNGEVQRGYGTFKEKILDILNSKKWDRSLLAREYAQFLQTFDPMIHPGVVKKFKEELINSYKIILTSKKISTGNFEGPLNELRTLLNVNSDPSAKPHFFPQGQNVLPVKKQITLQGSKENFEKWMCFLRSEIPLDDCESQGLLNIFKTESVPSLDLREAIGEAHDWVRLNMVRNKSILPIRKPPFRLSGGELCRWFGKTLSLGKTGLRMVHQETTGMTLLSNNGIWVKRDGVSFEIKKENIDRVGGDHFDLAMELKKNVGGAKTWHLGFFKSEAFSLFKTLFLKEHRPLDCPDWFSPNKEQCSHFFQDQKGSCSRCGRTIKLKIIFQNPIQNPESLLCDGCYFTGFRGTSFQWV